MNRILTFAFCSAFAIGVFGLPVFAQVPPPPGSFDPFDDDDFEGPPPAFNGSNNGANKPKTFGDTVGNQPPAAPDTSGAGNSASNGSSYKGGKTLAPQPKRNRKEAPNLLAHRPKNMVDAIDKDITDENFPDLIDSFDYPNAEITDIVKAISELTGKNFIVDPQIHGKITIIAPTRITVAEAYKAFLSALAINSLTVVPSGKFLKVKLAQNAQRDNLDTYSGNYSPSTDVMITRIMQLRYIQAKDVFNSLGPILQSRLGEMRPYEPTNTLIISDYGSNIERIMKILRQLDVPGFEEQLEVIRVRYAKAGDLAKLVDQIINKGKGGNNQNGGFNAGIPRFAPIGSNQTQGSDAYSLVIPDDRTNSLIAVGNTQGIEKIRKLVARLDFKLNPSDAGGVFVYYVRFGDAEKMATTLSGLAQSTGAAAASAPQPNAFLQGVANPTAQKAPIFSSDVKIASDKITNSLVITASKQDYEVIEGILKKLDIPRDQVYVEGILMELDVSQSHTWGISYYNLAGDTYAGRQGFVSTDVKSVLNPANDSGAVLGFGGGGQVTVPDPGGGSPIKIPSLVGFINFLASTTHVNILSTPQIMALDNEEAIIEVGENVAIGQTQSSTSGTVSTGAQREDVTIKLDIKPHISPASNRMRLEIDQQVKGIAAAPAEASQLISTNVAISKRNTKTNVMVHDGDTIVLGGLMKENHEEIVTKIPLLGDIPILGWLFKGKKTKDAKINLLMFLTPHIVRSKEDSTQLLEKKIADRVKFIEKNVSGKDAQGEYIDSVRVQKSATGVK
jgi:general secretion pathway protein D